ncbi:hypothetical protein [Rhodococcus ruber]
MIALVGNALAAALLSATVGLAAWLPWSLHADAADTRRQQMIVLVCAAFLAAAALGLTRQRYHTATAWRTAHTWVPATVALATLVFTAHRLGADLLSPGTIGIIALLLLALVGLLAFPAAAPVVALVISPLMLVTVWWDISPLPLVTGVVVGAAVLAVLWYASDHDGRAVPVVGLTIVGVAVGSTLIGISVPTHSPAIDAALARAVLHPQASVLHDGANFDDAQPILPGIIAVAGSDDGTTAAIVGTAPATAELWTFDNSGARRLVVGRSAKTPAGQSLLPDDGDTKYAARIAEALNGGADTRASLPSTMQLAFDRDTLYGLTGTVLWRLDGTGTIRTVHRWDTDAIRTFAVISPGTAAVLAKSEDGNYALDFLALDDGTVLGSPDLPPHHDDAGEKRATTGYIGPTATGEGKFLLLFDKKLHELSPSEDYSTLTVTPLANEFSADYAISAIHAGKNRLMVTRPNGSTVVYEDFRSTEVSPESPKITSGASMPRCASRMDTTSISSSGIPQGGFTPDGSRMVVVQNVDSCTGVLLSAAVDGPAPWIALNRSQARPSPEQNSTDRYVLGPLVPAAKDGSSAFNPRMSTLVEKNGHGAYRTQELPPRPYFSSSIYALNPVGNDYWAAGYFRTESKPDGEWVLVTESKGNWVPAPEFPGARKPGVYVRDIAAYSDHSAVIAFCDEIRIYNPIDQSTTPVFTRSTGRSNCDRKTDPGPVEAWQSTLGIPQAIDVVRGDSSNPVIYVADTKSTLDGATVWFGISMIDPRTGAIAPLPGADLTALRAAPIDVAVSENGQVCIATVHADRYGPLAVVSDGRLRLIDTDDYQVTGCGWNGTTLVATTAEGTIVQYDAPQFAVESAVFVP